MNLHYSDIPDGGLHIDLHGGSGRWDGLKGLPVERVPQGRFLVQRRGRDVCIEGVVRATLRLECSRCLETFPLALEVSVSQILHAEEERRVEAKEIELARDDLELATYDGENIPLEGVVEEHLLLSLPMRPLCHEACKGLCVGCGENLNLGKCGCPEGPGRSPFDSLKEFVVKER